MDLTKNVCPELLHASRLSPAFPLTDFLCNVLYFNIKAQSEFEQRRINIERPGSLFAFSGHKTGNQGQKES